jgi:hypothetical protein
MALTPFPFAAPAVPPFSVVDGAVFPNDILACLSRCCCCCWGKWSAEGEWNSAIMSGLDSGAFRR